MKSFLLLFLLLELSFLLTIPILKNGNHYESLGKGWDFIFGVPNPSGTDEMVKTWGKTRVLSYSGDSQIDHQMLVSSEISVQAKIYSSSNFGIGGGLQSSVTTTGTSTGGGIFDESLTIRAGFDSQFNSAFESAIRSKGKVVLCFRMDKHVATVNLIQGHLNPAFTKDVDNLPNTFNENDNLNLQEFESFISKYGTHFVKNANVGGFVYVLFELSTTLYADFKTELDQTADGSGTFNFKNIFATLFANDGGSATAFNFLTDLIGDLKGKSEIEINTEASLKIFNYGGLLQGIMLPDPLTYWSNSVESCPKGIKVELQTYLQFIPNLEKRNVVHQALLWYASKYYKVAPFLSKKEITLNNPKGTGIPPSICKLGGEPIVDVIGSKTTYPSTYNHFLMEPYSRESQSSDFFGPNCQEYLSKDHAVVTFYDDPVSLPGYKMLSPYVFSNVYENDELKLPVFKENRDLGTGYVGTKSGSGDHILIESIDVFPIDAVCDGDWRNANCDRIWSDYVYVDQGVIPTGQKFEVGYINCNNPNYVAVGDVFNHLLMKTQTWLPSENWNFKFQCVHQNCLTPCTNSNPIIQTGSYFGGTEFEHFDLMSSKTIGNDNEILTGAFKNRKVVDGKCKIVGANGNLQKIDCSQAVMCIKKSCVYDIDKFSIENIKKEFNLTLQFPSSLETLVLESTLIPFSFIDWDVNACSDYTFTTIIIVSVASVAGVAGVCILGCLAVVFCLLCVIGGRCIKKTTKNSKENEVFELKESENEVVEKKEEIKEDPKSKEEKKVKKKKKKQQKRKSTKK